MKTSPTCRDHCQTFWHRSQQAGNLRRKRLRWMSRDICLRFLVTYTFALPSRCIHTPQHWSSNSWTCQKKQQLPNIPLRKKRGTGGVDGDGKSGGFRVVWVWVGVGVSLHCNVYSWPGLQIPTGLSRLFRSYNATILDHNSSTRHMALLRFSVSHLKDRHFKAPVVKLLVDCCWLCGSAAFQRKLDQLGIESPACSQSGGEGGPLAHDTSV